MMAAASPQWPHSEIIAVGVMCKPPRPGVAKTRLAATIGAESAAALSECFLRDVARLIGGLEASHGVQGFGIYPPAAAEIRALLPGSFRLAVQQGEDFSGVVHHAAAGRLERHPVGAILINADSPTLPAALLAEEICALREPGERVVLGPAHDGGYYLIGLETADWSLFRDMPWRTPDVERITVARAKDIDLPVVRLPIWHDVDEADSAVLLDAIAGAAPNFANPQDADISFPAPATRAFFQSHPMVERLCGNALNAGLGS